MTDVLARARTGDEGAFRDLTDPYRRELQLHCYRFLGSLHDAEDLLQETLLAAWRGLDGFEGRASVRAWLYRIATNRCLNAVRDRGRREPPEQPAMSFQPTAPTRLADPTWLEPYPDSLIEAVPETAPGPEARVEAREAIELAFVLGLQRLPPRQRAVLVLRDVLGFRAAEVAEMLDMTEVSVKSALQRARATLDAETPVAEHGRAPLPDSPAERKVVHRFAEAFEGGDVDALVALMTEDAWVRMPPAPWEYQGAAAIAPFLEATTQARRGRPLRLVPTRANGQPAFAGYVEDPHTPIGHAMGLLVLTLDGDRIAALTRFENGVLARFGLPQTLRW